MEDFGHQLAAKLLSETGVVGGLLLAACLWLAKKWSDEREAHDKTIAKAFELSEKRAETSVVIAEALNGLKGMVERLTYMLGNGNGRQS